MGKKEVKNICIARRKAAVQSEPMHPVSDNPTSIEESQEVKAPIESETLRPVARTESATGGIALASASVVTEKDPAKAELIQQGYIIVAENEYGVIVRQAKGKPTFMAKTKDGYADATKRNTLLLPDSIDRAMKMRVASMGINVIQYLTQLVMKDLKEHNIII
jgi:hypothetical protein